MGWEMLIPYLTSFHEVWGLESINYNKIYKGKNQTLVVSTDRTIWLWVTTKLLLDIASLSGPLYLYIHIVSDFYTPVWKTCRVIGSLVADGQCPIFVWSISPTCIEEFWWNFIEMFTTLRSCVAHMNQVSRSKVTLRGHWKACPQQNLYMHRGISM
jgi:hypothetical protein